MGGGAMRTAAKAAAFGGYRSVSPFADPATAAARRARPPPAGAHVPGPAGEAPPAPMPVLSSGKIAPAPAPALQSPAPAWEVDEWEFAGGKEDELFDAIHPAPRLVFGPVPTKKEAEEATSDLKEALEKVYFSSSNSEVSPKVSYEATPGISAAILPAIPQHVVQAFSLLHESPEAQSVVASLASDINVWAAVMNNERVMEFYQKHQTSFSPETNVSAPCESEGENDGDKESYDIIVESPSSEAMEFITDLLQNIKLKVSEMVSSISDFLQEFMAPPPAASRSRPNIFTRTSTAEHYVDVGVGASFMALAIAAILVVLVKRA